MSDDTENGARTALVQAAVNAIKMMAFVEGESINSKAPVTGLKGGCVTDTATAMTILSYASCGLARACGLEWEEFEPLLRWTWERVVPVAAMTSKGGDA